MLSRRRTKSASCADTLVVAEFGQHKFADDTILDLGKPAANSTAKTLLAKYLPPCDLYSLEPAVDYGIGVDNTRLFKLLCPYVWISAFIDETPIYVRSSMLFTRDRDVPMFCLGRNQRLMSGNVIAAILQKTRNKIFDLVKIPELNSTGLHYLFEIFPDHGLVDQNKFSRFVGQCATFSVEENVVVMTLNRMRYGQSVLASVGS